MGPVSPFTTAASASACGHGAAVAVTGGAGGGGSARAGPATARQTKPARNMVRMAIDTCESARWAGEETSAGCIGRGEAGGLTAIAEVRGHGDLAKFAGPRRPEK